MRGKGRHRRRPALLDFFACFLIPAYTLLFAGSVEWFSTNFSVIAVTGEDHYRGFFLWGLLAAGYFLVLIFQIGRTFGRWRGRFVLYVMGLAACGCLAAALAVPYLPEDFPRWADLHVMLAFTACVLLMAALLFALLRCRRLESDRYRPLLVAWCLITTGCALLFLMAGIITSALEVFFTISTVLLTRKLWLYRQQR